MLRSWFSVGEYKNGVIFFRYGVFKTWLCHSSDNSSALSQVTLLNILTTVTSSTINYLSVQRTVVSRDRVVIPQQIITFSSNFTYVYISYESSF